MSRELIKNEKQQQRIEEEMKLHADIKTEHFEWEHPKDVGIVKLYQYSQSVRIQDKLYECIVLEYCEGSHLNEYLRRHPSDQLCEFEAFYFFRQIIQSLDCLHRQRVIHRDIKPQNLLLTFDNTNLPVLVEFAFYFLIINPIDFLCGIR